MSVFSEANEEYNNPDMKFKLFIVSKLGGNKKIADEKEFILFYRYFLEEKSKKIDARDREIEEIENKKIADDESKRERPSFMKSLAKWIVLHDIAFRIFLEKNGAPPYLATEKIIRDYFTDEQIDCYRIALERKLAQDAQNTNTNEAQ